MTGKVERNLGGMTEPVHMTVQFHATEDGTGDLVVELPTAILDAMGPPLATYTEENSSKGDCELVCKVYPCSRPELHEAQS